MKTKSQRHPGSATDSYLNLVREFPLKRIRSEAEYDAATAMAERLAIRGEEDLDEGETEYLDALATMIEVYDQEHYSFGPDTRTPLERLRALVKDAELSVNDLGKILGSQSAASMVLSGKRQLSKNHIRKLSEHFRIEPGYFL